MKYSVDRIEGTIAIIQDIDDATKKEVDLAELPKEIKDGDIVVYEDNKYTLDQATTQERKKTINNKFSRLIKNKPQ